MANYFSNRNKYEHRKAELNNALREIYRQEAVERENYITELTNLIKSRPNLTADQYAMLLTKNASERESIRTSIGNMAYVAEHHRKFVAGQLAKFEEDMWPTMPKLKRKEITVKRRFIEVDEDNNPIGTHEVEEYKYTYSMEG
jgi:hypothetical protein